jgi:SAM-dependent methyltransferase
MTTVSAEASFRAAYGAHRASEGRALDESAMLQLPFLRSGPLAKQWSVRARSYEVLLERVVMPLGRNDQLHVADLGAGNAWLSWRLAEAGHVATAIDVRDDSVDGLGAARPFTARVGNRLRRCVASFERLPLAPASCDLVVFNASLHYALDLNAALEEVKRVLRPAGRVAIVDSPFYVRDEDGAAMVEEKRSSAQARFGSRAAALMALTFVEYLTRERLAAAAPWLQWTRHKVSYPMWYELRPVLARMRGRRVPSRFDVWEGVLA